MSLDIAFPGFEHVYGIPERATSFALKPTPSEEGKGGTGRFSVCGVGGRERGRRVSGVERKAGFRSEPPA